jgi:orotidine-5'-phosphate decarboxylase
MPATTQWVCDMQARERLIIALDVSDVRQACDLIEATRTSCQTYKVGLEFFARFGPRGVERVRDMGVDVFLDLKLHDIPNTVFSALRQVLPLSPKFVTVHASGGPAMLIAAGEAVKNSRTKLLAVTVLTSLTTSELKMMGLTDSPAQIARKWLLPVKNHPAFGAVCSPHEAKLLKSSFGPSFTLVCPGVRPANSEVNDQSRIATPQQALHDGADYLVVGRPITKAKNPHLAARSILNEMEYKTSH